MAEDVKDLIIRLSVENDQLKKSIKEASEEGNKFNTKFNKIGEAIKANWLKVGAAVASVAVALKTGFDLTKEGAKFKQASQAMANQFGKDVNTILAKLKEVSAGTISNTDLVIAANRAMALNVTEDVDQMAQLLEIARIRARALGTDTTSAFNDIVTGIGRGSPLILDNLGIITKGWAEEAKATGQAYDAQFLLNKVIKEYGNASGDVENNQLTATENIQKFEASITNLKTEIGQNLIPIFTPLLSAFSKVFDIFSKLPSSIKSVSSALVIVTPAIAGVTIALGPLAGAIGVITSSILILLPEVLNLVEAFKKLSEAKGLEVQIAGSKELALLYRQLTRERSVNAKAQAKNDEWLLKLTQKNIDKLVTQIKAEEERLGIKAKRIEKTETEINQATQLAAKEIELADTQAQRYIDIKRLEAEQAKLNGDFETYVALTKEAITLEENLAIAQGKRTEISGDVRKAQLIAANERIQLEKEVTAVIEQESEKRKETKKEEDEYGIESSKKMASKITTIVTTSFNYFQDTLNAVVDLFSSKIENEIDAIDDSLEASREKYDDIMDYIETQREQELASETLLSQEKAALAEIESAQKKDELDQQIADLKEELAAEIDEESKADIQREIDALEHQKNILALEQQAAADREDLEAKLLKQKQEAEYEKAVAEWENAKAAAELKEKQFKLDKAMAMVNVVISTQAAIGQSFAQMGWIGGLIAMAALTTQMGIQLGIIGAQKAPNYDVPDMPNKGDYVTSSSTTSGYAMGGVIQTPLGESGVIGVQDRESILNRAATMELGEDTIDALNNGSSLVPGNVQIVVNTNNPKDVVDTLNDYFKQFGNSSRGLAI